MHDHTYMAIRIRWFVYDTMCDKLTITIHIHMTSTVHLITIQISLYKYRNIFWV